MKYIELVRSPSGTGAMYVSADPGQRRRDMDTALSTATRTGAKVTIGIINGFDSKHSPRYLYEILVLAPGKPAAKRGPKPKGV